MSADCDVVTPVARATEMTYGRVYFVSVDYNSVMGLTSETFSQKFSSCAAGRRRGGGLPGGGARDGG